MTVHRCPDCRCNDPEPPPAGRGSSDDKRRRLIDGIRRQLAEQKRERTAADPNGVTRTTVTKEKP